MHELLHNQVLNYVTLALSHTMLKEGSIIRAGVVSGNTARKVSSYKAHLHGKNGEVGSRSWGELCWESPWGRDGVGTKGRGGAGWTSPSNNDNQQIS